MSVIQNRPSFNYDAQARDLSDRFGRLVKQLGWSNRKGTDRYDYEVSFAYALNEVRLSPAYIQEKKFERAASIVSSLHRKIQEGRAQ